MNKVKYCKMCGKKITFKSTYCNSCCKIGRKRPDISKNPINYIDGRCSKIYYCINCGKEIHYKTWKEGTKRCHKCAGKVYAKRQKKLYKISKNHPMYGKHHTKETKEKMSNTRTKKELSKGKTTQCLEFLLLMVNV